MIQPVVTNNHRGQWEIVPIVQPLGESDNPRFNEVCSLWTSAMAVWFLCVYRASFPTDLPSDLVRSSAGWHKKWVENRDKKDFIFTDVITPLLNVYRENISRPLKSFLRRQQTENVSCILMGDTFSSIPQRKCVGCVSLTVFHYTWPDNLAHRVISNYIWLLTRDKIRNTTYDSEKHNLV